MFDLDFLLVVVAAYLTGAFPTSFLLGKLFYNIDVRKFGSGNAGATNTFRVLGKIPGIIVLLLDILKGYVVVNYIYFIDPKTLLEIVNTDLFFEYQLLFLNSSCYWSYFQFILILKEGRGLLLFFRGPLLSLNLTAALYSCVVF